MAYIKSYSNYVVQKKHQLLNDGTVFERDFTTIGGIGDNFKSEGKKYRQGTFVYSLNDGFVAQKIYNSIDWEKNGENDFFNKENLTTNTQNNNSLKISLKQDFFKLKDFAYYGSCSELIRSSINDIINNFPGEIYAPIINNEGIIVLKENGEKLDEEFPYLVDNPFSIDAHTNENIINYEEKHNIKFLQSNYDKYEYFDGSTTHNINKVLIENYNDGCIPYCFCKITIMPKTRGEKFYIKCYYDENGTICYLTNSNGIGKYIRPKKQYYDNFINNLDTFQKVLLNVNSEPKYSTVFELMEETDYGYKTFYKKFTFPVSYGGYNLDIVSVKFKEYINTLSQYGDFYDELYCNNIYRQMTHESIKNFDWSDSLNRDNETKDDYNENGEKIQKLLQLFGREFDEIKVYIDGIKNTNIITYNDKNNLPDYFLTDKLNLDGWDIKNIFPYSKSETTIYQDFLINCQPYANLNKGCGDFISYPNGYFSGYWTSGCTQSKITSNDNYLIDNHGVIRNNIKQYTNNKQYSSQEVNNKFMKYLKLNSRSILNKKGTISGIESILSIFGLKSKRWYDSLEKKTQNRLCDEMKINSSGKTYDYEIIEYVTIAEPIQEIENLYDRNLPVSKNLIDFFNSTKTLVYNTTEYINGQYTPYQGLPIRYYTTENGQRYLYPYFSKNMIIDGKPYYQMNGGWLNKDYSLTNDTPFINTQGFTDTNTQISTVNSIKDLLSIEDELLYDGLIYYVKNFKGHFVCIDNSLYDVEYDLETRYIKVSVQSGSIQLGEQSWYGTIKTFNETYDVIDLDLNKFTDGSYVNIYINTENNIHVVQENSQDISVLINYVVIRDGQVLSIDGNENNYMNGTNYFILYDKKWAKTIGLWGWNQLTDDSVEYKTITNIKRDYNANNPHTNCTKYDSGVEYLKYFYNLFKHAMKNESFNQNCYSSLKEYMYSLNMMEKEIGFKNLLNDDLTIKLYKDNKIHSFCDKIDKLGNIKYFYELNGENNDNQYNFYDTLNYKNLKNDKILKNTYINDKTCLDQIVNVKNIDIIFYKNRKNNEDENILQCKYLDEIILHYLSQVLPPNAIINIKYK